ncbi:DUF4381 domain-containing protein [Roseomonas gilardii]|uniref:DUF4381 domain-containing protein n=1 Tax=Roseomonas gilardii TaxID=257708 RepID=A0ABU3MIT8_9PROT|nr:DUF4381 domain-containing protein [Roseomonas gilardii]MDT8332929.1 DUF4381 domain-containing protein [Roseomonas gilardii]
MNSDLPPQPSLQGMHDILLPPPVPLTPATPAWAVLGVLLLALLLWGVWRGWQRWRREAYRREARRALDAMAARGEFAPLPALVKRTALAVFPREAVAGLTGADWAAFLRRTAPRAHLSEAQAMALARLPYLGPTDAQAAGPVAIAAARGWITRHDRPVHDRTV